MTEKNKHGRTLEAVERSRNTWLKKQADGIRVQAVLEPELSALINEAHEEAGIAKWLWLRSAALMQLDYEGYDVSKWL